MMFAARDGRLCSNRKTQNIEIRWCCLGIAVDFEYFLFICCQEGVRKRTFQLCSSMLSVESPPVASLCAGAVIPSREYPSPISHYLQFAKHFEATPETALCRESTSSGISNTDGTFNFNVHSFCCFPSAVSSVAILSNNACMNSKVKNRDRNVNIVSTNSSAANASAIQFIPYFVNCKRSVLFLVHSSVLFVSLRCLSLGNFSWQQL